MTETVTTTKNGTCNFTSCTETYTGVVKIPNDWLKIEGWDDITNPDPPPATTPKFFTKHLYPIHKDIFG